jgi:hypothetical protein
MRQRPNGLGARRTTVNRVCAILSEPNSRSVRRYRHVGLECQSIVSNVVPWPHSVQVNLPAQVGL